MKEIKIEDITYHYVYEAADGTQFDDKQECIVYENSAIGVIKGRIKEFCIKETTEDDLFHAGSCDNEVWVCVPKTLDDIDKIRQFLLITGNSEERVNRLKDDQVGRVVFVYIGYNNEWSWFRTLDDILEYALGNKDYLNKDN